MGDAGRTRHIVTRQRIERDGISMSLSERSGSRDGAAPSHLGWLAACGAALVAVAVMLYASGLSRAVGLVVLGVGVAAVIAAALIRIRGSWPSPAWFVFAIALLAALAALGIGTWIYAVFFTHNISV